MATLSGPEMQPSSAIHRLPTVSASQALRNLRSKSPASIPTGLPRLDSLLAGHGSSSEGLQASSGGLTRGQVTEIHGPPGVGKTLLALQTCANVILQGGHAVWVDTASPLVRSHLNDFLRREAFGGAGEPGKDVLSEKFHHFTAPTLPHLLALFVHPTASFPPSGTGVIAIDNISTPFESAYHREGHHSTISDAARWAAGRKFAVMSELVGKIGKMAALNNLAVILTCQTSTRLRQDAPAILLPSISGSEWDNGITTQLCLFRDFAPPGLKQSQNHEVLSSTIRYAGVVKANAAAGIARDEHLSMIVPFTVDQDGLREVNVEPASLPAPVLSSPERPRKKPREVIEIGDSEEEELGSEDDYGWGDEDDMAAEGLMEGPDETLGPATEKASLPESPTGTK